MKSSHPFAPPPGMRAVFIPEDVFLKIETAGQLIGLLDPVNTAATGLLAELVTDPSNLIDILETYVS